MNVSILSGSSRPNNNSIRIAKAIESKCKILKADTSLVDFKNYDLPFFNQGNVKKDNMSSFQEHLYTSMADADLVVIVTPEYNWLPSSELINMIDQYGVSEFRDIFEGKVFAFVGISSGMGGRMPTVQLSYAFDKIISFMGTHSITCPKKFEAHHVHAAIDPNGGFVDQNPMEKHLDRFLSYCMQTAQRWGV